MVWSHFIQLVQGVPSLTTLHFLLRLASRFQVLGVSGWDGGPNLDLLAFPTEVGILFVSRFQVSVGQARSEARLVLSHIHTY